MKRLARYFLQGLLYVAPLGLTIYIIWVGFLGIDRLLTGQGFKRRRSSTF